MKKSFFEQVKLRQSGSFSIQEHWIEKQSELYHYHPHYELVLIKKGDGELFVNKVTEVFSEGDLILLGPYLQHYWKHDTSKTQYRRIHRITIEFRNDFMGEDFFSKPELREIKQLLEMSRSGILYHKNQVSKVSDYIDTIMNEQVIFKKLHTFLDVLYKLSASRDFKLLSKGEGDAISASIDQDRIGRVNNYILENYRGNISLTEVAQIACMTPNAFCRYFKKTTQRTFMDVVVEYRLNYALKQLLHTIKPVKQICSESGFNDIVHFGRLFKNRMQISPVQYRKMYTNKIVDDFDCNAPRRPSSIQNDPLFKKTGHYSWHQNQCLEPFPMNSLM